MIRCSTCHVPPATSPDGPDSAPYLNDLHQLGHRRGEALPSPLPSVSAPHSSLAGLSAASPDTRLRPPGQRSD